MEAESETRSDVGDSSKRQKTSSTDDWKERLLGHLLRKIVEQDFTAIAYTEGINRFFSSPHIPEEEDDENEKSFRDQVFRLLHELFGAEARGREEDARADNCLTIVLVDAFSENHRRRGDAAYPNLRRLFLKIPPKLEKLVLISEISGVSYLDQPRDQGEWCFGPNVSPIPPTLKSVVFHSSQWYVDFNYYFSLFRNAESLDIAGLTSTLLDRDTPARFPSRCKHLSLRFDYHTDEEDDDDNEHFPYRTNTDNRFVDFDIALKSAPIYQLTANLSNVESLSVKLSLPVKFPNLFWRKLFGNMGPENSLRKLKLDISEVVDDLHGERILRAMAAESVRPAQKCTGLRELTILGRQSNEINLNALETLAFILGPQITHLDLSGFQFNYEFAPTLSLFQNVTDFRLKFDDIEPTSETRVAVRDQSLLFDRSRLQVLPTLTKIKRLELDGFFLQSPGCIPIHSLETLVLRESKLARASEQELGIEDFLSEVSSLRSLRLFDFHVSSKELQDILRIFPELERLEIEDFKETPYDAETCSQLAKATKAHKHLLQVRINLGDSTVEAKLHCLKNRLEHSFEDFWKNPVQAGLLASMLECSDRIAGTSGMYWILKEKLVSDLGFG